MPRNRIGALVGLVVMAALGVRTSAPHASPWSEAAFDGSVRARVITSWSGSDGLQSIEAFTRGSFGTETSSFGKGLVLSLAFPVPGADRAIELSLDLSRHGDRTLWPADASDVIVAALVERRTSDGAVLFEGAASEGELVLERIVVGETLAGFRISGLLRFAAEATGDPEATWRDVELVLETDPPPEAVSPADPDSPPLPLRATCHGEACYADPAYDVAVTDPDPGACDGGDEVIWDAPEEEDDPGCESDDDDDPWTSDSSGDETYPSGGACEGTDDTDDETYPQGACDGSADDDETYPSGGACDGGTDDDDDWEDDSGGCGSDDDELERPADRPPVILTRRPTPPMGRTLAGWLPIMILAVGGLLIDRR